MIDLHLHSNCSDGLDTPSQLVDQALELKLKAIALTDHDSMDGLEELLSYGEEKDIITIPGIEISIKDEPDRELNDVHIVGLNIDFRSSKINNAIKQQLIGRIEQKRQICNRLREEFDYKITFDEVKAIAGPQSVGRPHIVEILIRNNPDKIKGKSKDSLFKLISSGGVAYVERQFEFTLEESIELIESSGGVAILAHPGVYEVSDRTKFVEQCVKAGIKGIEIEYTYAKNRPFYNTDKDYWAQDFLPNFFRTLANKFHLVKSGGSDYHGSNKGIKLGEANVPDEYLNFFI